MSRKPWDIHIGFDPREAAAFSVARESIKHFHKHCCIWGVVLSELRSSGLYYRPTERRLGRLWDVISGAYMSTEFAISRFLVPEIVKRMGDGPYGWSLFMDCDVLVRGSLNRLFEHLDDSKALYCVKHDYTPSNNIKMDGQKQDAYPRKNWSSVMAFNMDHPANSALTIQAVNTLPGRDLHRMCWLNDDEIGELGPEYNYLVGDTTADVDPRIVHFTNGIPTMPGCHDVEYADEWFAQLERWAA